MDIEEQEKPPTTTNDENNNCEYTKVKFSDELVSIFMIFLFLDK